MAKANTLSSMFFRAIGRRYSMDLMRRRYTPSRGAEAVEFPRGFRVAGKILIILPSDALAALHQVPNLLSLVGHFANSEIVLLCESHVLPYFQRLAGVSRAVEYREGELELGGKRHQALGRAIGRERFDLCLLLDRQPTLDVLVLAAQTGAAVRAGYFGHGLSPFLNVMVKPSETGRYLPEVNMLLANAFGARPRTQNRWAVSQTAHDEVAHLLRECSITIPSTMIGIDGFYFFREFGEQWTERLLAQLKDRESLTLYIYGVDPPSDKRLSAWVTHQRIPVFHSLSISHLAGLIDRSKVILSGRTALFELSRLLQKDSVGIFSSGDALRFFKETPYSRAVVFEQRPDDTTVRNVICLVDQIAVSTHAASLSH
jgi:ADP-heptose:LPS heptosyltransferase